MTEGTELAIEQAAAGVMFCLAVSILFLLHTALWKQTEVMGTMPEQLVLFEETGESTWKPSDE